MLLSHADFLHNANLKEVLVKLLENGVYSKPTIAIGTSSKAKIKLAALVVKVNNTPYALNAGEVAFTATTDDIAADAGKIQEKTYLVYTDGSTVKILGSAQADEDGSSCPECPADHVKLGEVLIQIAAGSTNFDASTDELDAAHITDTYTDKLNTFNF